MPEKNKAAAPTGDEAPCKIQKCEEEVQADIPDEALMAEVQSLLMGADLAGITVGQLRARLEGNLGLSAGTLAARKFRRRISFLVHREVLKKSQRSEECEKIAEELLRLDLPMPVRQMLIDSLHHSVSMADGTELHPHQVRLLSIARDALLEGQNQLDMAQQQCKDGLLAAEAELRKQDQAGAAARSDAFAANEVASRATAAFNETEAEVADMQKDLESATQRAKDAVEESGRLQGERRRVGQVSLELGRLAQGTWSSEEEWWECFALLQQHMLDTGAESSLLTAATVSLKKRPAERSDFDAMAVDGVTGFLQDQLAAADQHLTLRPQKEMEAEAAVLGVQALLSATCQRKEQQAQALQQAVASQEAAAATCAALETALPSVVAEVERQRQQEVCLETRHRSLNEALELVAAWILGSAIPGREAVAAVLPVSEDPPEAKEQVSKMDVAIGLKDGLLDVASPLRVKTRTGCGP
ncbi:unnamed protein product [Effrenium voratum]|nr:unnamed protein product [Effrenium voratum]